MADSFASFSDNGYLCCETEQKILGENMKGPIVHMCISSGMSHACLRDKELLRCHLSKYIARVDIILCVTLYLSCFLIDTGYHKWLNQWVGEKPGLYRLLSRLESELQDAMNERTLVCVNERTRTSNSRYRTTRVEILHEALVQSNFLVENEVLWHPLA